MPVDVGLLLEWLLLIGRQGPPDLAKLGVDSAKGQVGHRRLELGPRKQFSLCLLIFCIQQPELCMHGVVTRVPQSVVLCLPRAQRNVSRGVSPPLLAEDHVGVGSALGRVGILWALLHLLLVTV